MRTPVRITLALASIGVAVVLWQTLLGPGARGRRVRAEITRSLHSTAPETRKQAAWAAIERSDLALVAILVEGVLGAEPDENVREAYVYALGKIGDPRNLAAIESAIDSDPSGYVRAAAWLAAARGDPDHFRTLTATRAASQQPWDRLGVAQGRLYLGDVGGVNELLALARGGDAPQRQVASRALYKWLRPILDSAGRWPADAEIREGEPWPPALTGEVARRCEALDLDVLADGLGRHRAAAERVRRNVLRITRVRDDLRGLLWAD